MSYGKNSKIFLIRFQPVRIYNIRHFKGRDDIYQKYVIIQNDILQIGKITEFY